MNTFFLLVFLWKGHFFQSMRSLRANGIRKKKLEKKNAFHIPDGLSVCSAEKTNQLPTIAFKHTNRHCVANMGERTIFYNRY